ncbi:high mobility group box domain-containing protein [Kickxella alabastrina]|uniref:high mobility group box domain-containing protein n=1 Tax=Kickxella alabastrina TaxID=61397 RepID=UPI0022212542|nr:high mobility group box domain-containing protein [Kickxella alabastrina]KAI7833298.1 high mobility group box domain-containing protein [Kickxella alabastrina]KAJ1932998.1 Non-histone chromosomal protein 6 [Kickxella alabastrina]
MARGSKAAAAAPVKTKAVSAGRVTKPRTTKVETTRAAKKAKRSKKDPNAPKRALSAYMYFSQAKRKSVKDENPDATFGNIGKLLGEKWKAMSDREKIPFMKQAEDDKKRYEAEKASYVQESHDEESE